MLKLLIDNFAPGDVLVDSTLLHGQDLAAQTFQTRTGKKLLILNKRGMPEKLRLRSGMQPFSISLVSLSTGDKAPVTHALQGDTLLLEPFEVTVVPVR